MFAKMFAAGLAVALIASTLPSATAQAAPRKRVVTMGARVATADRPRARVRVQPRSFLDAGTEVLPGDRKFTDYALPPTYMPLGVVTNVGGRVGWHNSPLPGPFDLPSRRNPFGW